MTRPSHGRSTLAADRGQALTEFLAVCLALFPLILLIPVVAKVQDIGHAAQAASRYAAFEPTTRSDRGPGGSKPEGELASELRRRFFSASDAPVKTGDVAGDFSAHRNPFWVGPLGESLIASFADVSLQIAYRRSSDLLPFQYPASAMGLASQGLRDARVQVRLERLPAGLKFYVPFDQIDLSLARRTVLLAEGWSATGPADVDARVARPAVFPGSALSVLSGLLEPIMTIVEPGLTPPGLGRLDFWQDLVPADRMRPP